MIAIIGDFAQRYFSQVLGLEGEELENTLVDESGNIREEYSVKLQELIPNLGDDFWAEYEADPDTAVNSIIEQEQSIAEYKKGGKLQYLASLKKGGKMKKKCACGCDLIMAKGEGGKLTSTCACKCGGKITKSAKGGKVIPSDETWSNKEDVGEKSMNPSDWAATKKAEKASANKKYIETLKKKKADKQKSDSVANLPYMQKKTFPTQAKVPYKQKGGGLNINQWKQQPESIRGRFPNLITNAGQEFTVTAPTKPQSTLSPSSQLAKTAIDIAYPKTPNTAVSVVDYLNSMGRASDKTSRLALAKELGVENYDFSAGANLRLLQAIKTMGRNDRMMQTIETPTPASINTTTTIPVKRIAPNKKVISTQVPSVPGLTPRQGF